MDRVASGRAFGCGEYTRTTESLREVQRERIKSVKSDSRHFTNSPDMQLIYMIHDKAHYQGISLLQRMKLIVVVNLNGLRGGGGGGGEWGMRLHMAFCFLQFLDPNIILRLCTRLLFEIHQSTHNVYS